MNTKVTRVKTKGKTADLATWLPHANCLRRHNGPLRVTDKGSKYVLVAADCFTK